MADDELMDEDDELGSEPADLEEDIDEDELADDLDEDDLDDEGIPGDGDDEPGDDEEEGGEDPKGEATPSRKKRDEEDEEDEDGPDDVEADLDTILKDRIAASDDPEEEEELEEADARSGSAEGVDGVQPKKANEFVCPGCFLLVNAGQFGPADSMECPVGESVCPAIEKLRKQQRKARK